MKMRLIPTGKKSIVVLAPNGTTIGVWQIDTVVRIQDNVVHWHDEKGNNVFMVNGVILITEQK